MKQKMYVTNKRFGIQTTLSTDAFLNNLPKGAEYRRKASTGKVEETDTAARTEVSIITTNALDGDNEVVVPEGIRLTRFLENPVVLMCHEYTSLPVGTCQWIKPIDNGLKAKSFYPNRPKDFTGDWFVDTVYGLVAADVLRGKSIGFVELVSHKPTREEIEARPELAECTKIIDECELLEYSVVSVPCNPEAVLLEKISKQFPKDHLAKLGFKMPAPNAKIKDAVEAKLKIRNIKLEDLTDIILKKLNRKC